MAARRLPFRADPAPNPPRRRVRVTFDGKAIRGIRRGAARGRAVGCRPTDPVPQLPLPPAARVDVQHRPVRLVRMRGRWPAERAVVPGPRPRRAGGAGRARLAVRGARPVRVAGRRLALGATDLLSPSIPAAAVAPQAVPRRDPRVRRSGPAGERSRQRGAHAGRSRAGYRRPRGRWRAGRRGRGRGGGRAAASAWRSSRPSRAGLDPRHPDIRVLDGAAAVGWYDGVVTAIDDETLWSIRAGSVIAATGSYERVPSVRGADRPGVIGARLALALIEEHRVLPGERPILVGETRDLAQVGAGVRERRRSRRSGRSRLPRCGGCSAGGGSRARSSRWTGAGGGSEPMSSCSATERRTWTSRWRPAPRSSCATASWRRSSTRPGGRPCPGCRSWAPPPGGSHRPRLPLSQRRPVVLSSASARTSMPTRSMRRSRPATATRSW